MEREPEGTITHYFGKLRDGDWEAAEYLWKHFDRNDLWSLLAAMTVRKASTN